MNKPLLKLSHINIKEKNWRVNGVSCMRIMSHQVLRIPSTQSSCPHTVYSTNNPIYLILFPSPFTNRASLFFFVFVSFLCFYWLFQFKFCFIMFRFNLIFVNFSRSFLVLLQFSLPRWTSNNFRLFPTSIRKTK